MKCIIIANGDLEYTRDILELIKNAKLIICADGGGRHLRALNILPDVMIGDFDSIHPDDLSFFKTKKVQTITFPRDKDLTDTELCVSWALENKADDITFLGVTGTRLDHTLANIFLLKKLAQCHVTARIINSNNEIYLVSDFLELKGNPEDFLSIIPVTRTVTGITLTGTHYPLKNATIEMGSSIGISNYFKQATISVCVKKGVLIVIKSKD